MINYIMSNYCHTKTRRVSRSKLHYRFRIFRLFKRMYASINIDRLRVRGLGAIPAYLFMIQRDFCNIFNKGNIETL